MPVYTVGQNLGNGLTVVSDVVTDEPDGSVMEVMTDSAGDVSTIYTPPPGSALANNRTIMANILTRQSQIQAWIAANPTGAVLTAGQTLTLAEMLNGLCKLLLSQFTSTTGT
jgi:hypothetical protein